MSKAVNRKRGALIDVDPRVEFLATSNTPPLERERIEMSATLVHVRTLIESLKPKKMAAQRTRLEAYADKLASVIHPMRFIPPEILSEIFSHVVADPDIIDCIDVSLYDFVDSLDTKSGVWALTHVCSRWRTIATNTSSLWTTIGLPFDKHPKSSVTADILATYLERSNQHALNVIVYSKDEISEQPAMQILMKTCARWRGGCFALPLETFAAWQTAFSFKQLEKLRVYIQQPELTLAAYEEDSTATCYAFGDAPNLIDVAVDNHVIFYELFDLDWTTLHRFSQVLRLPEDFFWEYPASEILCLVMILSEASSLEIAQFDLHEFEPDSEDEWVECVNGLKLKHGGVFRNEALSFLVLNGGNKSWMRMLSMIELPNLQALQCHPNVENLVSPPPPPAAIGRSLCKLVVHVIDKTDTEAIKAFLNVTPDLLDLKMIFSKSFSIGAMCAEVFRMTPDSKLVPRLERLTLTTCWGTKVMIKKEIVKALRRGDWRNSRKLDVRII